MSVTALCTSTEVNQIWSSFGVTSRADDDLDGSSDAGIVTAVIEEASAKVGAFLLARYAVATLAASAWVKWATAHLAAVILGKRRGMPIPESMQEAWNEYREELQKIKDGQEQLIGDNGLATPRYDVRPGVSNFVVDGNYFRSKVRRVPATSTPSQAASGTKSKNAYDVGLGYDE